MSWSSPRDAGFGAATLVILSGANSTETDAKLARLAEKWGIRAVFVDSESGAPLDIVNHIGQQERVCLAASAASLARLFRAPSALLGNFLSTFPAALFHGFDGSPGTNEVLSWLTGNPQQETVALPDSAPEVSFSADLPAGCAPLRGLGFRLDDSGRRWRGFPGLSGIALMKMGELASFVSFIVGGWLNELYGWRMTFFLMGIPGLILAILFKLTIIEPRLQLGTQTIEVQPHFPPMRAVLTRLWSQRSAAWARR